MSNTAEEINALKTHINTLDLKVESLEAIISKLGRLIAYSDLADEEVKASKFERLIEMEDLNLTLTNDGESSFNNKYFTSVTRNRINIKDSTINISFAPENIHAFYRKRDFWAILDTHPRLNLKAGDLRWNKVHGPNIDGSDLAEWVHDDTTAICGTISTQIYCIYIMPDTLTMYMNRNLRTRNLGFWTRLRTECMSGGQCLALTTYSSGMHFAHILGPDKKIFLLISKLERLFYIGENEAHEITSALTI